MSRIVTLGFDVTLCSEMQANGKYKLTWTTEDQLEIELKIKDVFTRSDMTTRSSQDEQVFNDKVVATMVENVQTVVTTGLENKVHLFVNY